MPRAPKNKQDYGRFIASPLFQRLFPHYSENHEKAAEELVSRVFSQCYGKSDYPKIETLVDIGCGDGCFLLKIKDQIRKYNDKIKEETFRIPIRRYIGLDVSSEAIRQANKNKRKARNVKFERETNCAPNFIELSKTSGFEFERGSTALLVLSHTWFHFVNQKTLLQNINEFRPALIIIDIFHSWDATLHWLKNHPFKHEPISSNRSIFLLRTQSHGLSRVWRGVYQIKRTGKKYSRKWRFKSDQVRVTTDQLFGTEDELSEIDTARSAGQLTGGPYVSLKTGCDYVRCQETLYLTGWGFMRNHVLLAVHPVARVINKAFLSVVESIIKEQRVGWEARNLLAFFHRQDGQHPPCLHGEIALLQPFDPNRAFARFVSLVSTSHEGDASKHDVIVESPERSQKNYPTAYGLYNTMLSPVSSMQASPLRWAPNYVHSDVDDRFDDLETNQLLHLPKQTASFAEHHKSAQKSGPAFFIVPIYLGSLPLFSIILESPSYFPVAASDAGIYQSTLRNVHDQVKLTFTEEYIRNKIISPFIAKALDELHLYYNPSCGTKGVSASSTLDSTTHVIEDYLNQIRGMLDGSRNYNGIFQADPAKLGGVLGKPWKSWLLTIPSVPIKQLESTKLENQMLVRVFREEAKRALRDDELRISYWFQSGHFFEKCDCPSQGRKNCDGSAHDEWCPNKHYERLSSMLISISATAENFDSSSYFIRSRGTVLLDWTKKQIKELRTLETGNDNEKRTHIYRDLKSVFCKQLANSGGRFRFGSRRLFCMVQAAIGDVPILPPCSKGIHLASDIEKSEGQGFYTSRQDPTLHISKLLETLTKTKCLKKVLFHARDRAISITLTLGSQLSHERGGEEFKPAIVACEHLELDANGLYNKTTIGLSVRVTTTSDMNNKLRFEVKWK